MNRTESKPKRSAVLLDFGGHRVKQLAREYARRYLQYGPECASIWSAHAVAKCDKILFGELVRREMRKYGIKS